MLPAITPTEVVSKSPSEAPGLLTSTCSMFAQGLLRDEFSREWEAYPEQEAAGAWRHLEDPATTKVLGGVLARLSGGKRAKL